MIPKKFIMKKNSVIIHNHQGIRDLLPHIGLYLKSKGFNIIFIVKTKQDIKFYKKNNSRECLKKEKFTL